MTNEELIEELEAAVSLLRQGLATQAEVVQALHNLGHKLRDEHGTA